MAPLASARPIISMRETLATNLGKGKNDIKYSRGGVVDLEFVGYIFQLYKGKRIGNTFFSLKELAREEKEFKKGIRLYKLLREAETEKRLFGEFINWSDRIEALKKEVREFYKEFVEWIEKRI